MPDLNLRSAAVGNLAPDVLARMFSLVEQPAVATADGIRISPRGAANWLRYDELATRGFDPDEFTDRFVRIDRRVNPMRRLEALGRMGAREAVDSWLEKGDFGQLAGKFLETNTPDERHLWLREIVLPRFFEAYPAGRLACVTYSAPVNGYLAHLNTLQRMSVLNSSDQEVLSRYIGRDAMSSFQLNVPAELVWLMLSFASINFFPETYVFVASCEYLYFLIFITDRAVVTGQEDERHTPIERLVPKTIQALDSRPSGGHIVVNRRFVRPNRTYPFNRSLYSADLINLFLRDYVSRLDGLLRWMCEATNFATAGGEFDLDFALQTYLTVYVLLNSSFRIVTEQTDMFSRKMGFFDVLELYAGLVNSANVSAQTHAWKTHMSSAFATRVSASLQSYVGPFGEDLSTAASATISDNLATIRNGLLYGENPVGTVTVPNRGDVPFDEFAVELLRTLRNTKHGFSIRGGDYLAVHNGDLSNDLPDYTIALWLNFVTDQSSYTLIH